MRIVHYDLNLAILPENVPEVYDLWGGSIHVQARVDLDTLAVDAVPGGGTRLEFAVYRLLQVSRVAVIPVTSGGPLIDIPFETAVEILPDMPTYQVRLIHISHDALRNRADADGRISLYFEYGGPICGAREAMTYVHDHVSKQYTLLREEVYWYPKRYRGGSGPTYFGQEADAPTYDVKVTCPVPQTAVTGGTLLAVESVPAPSWAPDSSSNWARYHWRADVASFMGISCANYRKHTSVDGRVTLYCFPADDQAVSTAMAVVERTMALCERWLGPTTQHGNLVVAEIPSGWGSQSSPLLILQTADSLAAAATPAGEKRLYSELGHEVAHFWSVPSIESENTRWLDEGMTHFMEALLLEEVFGPDAYAERLAKYRSGFARDYGHVATVPLAACGTHLYRDTIARGKGPWVLAVLRELLGDSLLSEAMGRFTQTYHASGATPADFVAVAAAVAGLDLGLFFADWFETAVSSELLASEMTAREMASKYR